MVEQQPRFSDKELSILKNTFAENEDLLILLRKVMIQANLTEGEDILARKTFNNEELIKVLRRLFLPEIEPDAPINQIVDMWVETYNQNKDKFGDEVEPKLEARERVIAYIKQQIESLNGEGDITIDIKEFEVKNPNIYINFIAHSELYRHIEMMLMQIKLLAGNKDETPDETLKRLKKNSTK